MVCCADNDIRRFSRMLAGALMASASFIQSAGAVTPAADVNVSGGSFTGGVETIVALSGTDGSRTAPYVFDWADMNGDGSAGPAATADLVLGGYKVYTTDPAAGTRSFTLKLNGGSVTGSTAAGVTAFDTSTTPFGFSAGHISILNVSNVVIGKVAATRAAGDINGGDFTVGSAGLRAGYIRIGSIDVHAGNDGKTSGNVALYGSGDIEIRDDSTTNGIRTATDVPRQASGTGKITLSHQGRLVVGDLDSGSLWGNQGGADIVLDGAGITGAPSGAAVIGNIYAGRYPSLPVGANHKGSSATVRGYTGVTVAGDIITRRWEVGGVSDVVLTNIGTGGVAAGDIDTRELSVGVLGGRGGDVLIRTAGAVSLRSVTGSSAAATNGGNLTVEAGGNIAVSGAIDLNGGGGNSFDGVLVLSNTAANATISVGSLDLGKVVSATLRPGNFEAVVTNTLLNFPVANPTNGSLRAISPEKIRYNSAISGNAYLTNGYSGIFNLQGGGQLTCNFTRPEVMSVGVSNVGTMSATLLGCVYTGSAPTTVSAVWWVSGSSTASTNSLGVCSNGYVAASISGLSPDTTYRYCFYVTNSVADAWSPATNSFKTLIRVPSFQRKMQITFSRYDKADTLTNFPALIVFSNGMASGFSYGQFASTNGWDLRFQDSTGTGELNYEIESWNTNANSYVWVQVPEFRSNGWIWAYWGNPQSTSSPAIYTTNGATWENASGYQGVWHFANGTAVSGLDSTVFRRDGGLSNGLAAAAGLVGGCASLDGVNDYVNLQDIFNSATQGSISAWINPAASNMQIYCGGDYNARLYFSVDAAFRVAARFGANATFTSSSSLSTNNQWYLATVTWTGAVGTIYINGMSAGTGTAGPAGNTNAESIGCYQEKSFNTANSFFNGRVDEVRVSSAAISSNWVWACYMNQSSNSIFSLYGAATPVSRPGTIFGFK